MKKVKKHLFMLGILLLFGVCVMLNANAICNNLHFWGDNSVKAATITKPAASQKAKELGTTVKPINSVTDDENNAAKSALAETDGNETFSETDTSGWNQGGGNSGNQDISVFPVLETSSSGIYKKPLKNTEKSSLESASKKQPVKKKEQPQQPVLPQPITITQPITNSTQKNDSDHDSESTSIRISAVTLNKSDLSLVKNETAFLEATVSPSNTTQSKTVVWSSSDNKIATVDGGGKVTAVEKGNAVIMAAASNGLKAVCKVTVSIPATKVTVNLTDLSLEKGDSRTLTAAVEPLDTTDKVSWATSNSDIVSVDSDGKVTAVATGSAVITAKAGTVSATCNVSVGISITQLKLSDSALSLKKGESKTLSAIITPQDATESKTVTWSSSNPKAAAVDNTGKVTAIEGGSAIITAKAGLHSAECKVSVSVPVTGITLNNQSLSIDLGASETLVATITPSDATTTDIDWTSSDSNIAAVDGVGKITAVNGGHAVITAASKDGGFKAQCNVSVVVSISRLDLSDTSLSLKKGESKTLSATIMPQNTTESKTVTWSSSNPKSATVDNTGKVTAIEGGSATITAKVGSHVAECAVTVSVPVTGITLNKTSLTLTKGTGAVLKATLLPADATDQAVAWSSSNENVATVDGSGKIETVGAGTAVITATSHDGGFTAQCTVTVVIPVTGITLDQENLSIIKGNSQSLSAAISPVDATDRAVVWSSSNEKVATVDSNGKLTAVEGGTTVITVKTHDGGFTAVCQVTVAVPVSGVSLNKSADTLVRGASDPLIATISPADTTNKGVTWSSSNPGVATVDGSGKVTAVAPGTTTVTVKTNDGGFTASCQITVAVPVTGVSLNKTADTLFDGDVDTLIATVWPSGATNKGIIWSSSDTSVATVDGSGRVTAISGGTAVITAKTADGGFTSQCSLDIYDCSATNSSTSDPGYSHGNVYRGIAADGSLSFPHYADDASWFHLHFDSAAPITSITITNLSYQYCYQEESIWVVSNPTVIGLTTYKFSYRDGHLTTVATVPFYMETPGNYSDLYFLVHTFYDNVNYSFSAPAGSLIINGKPIKRVLIQ